MSDSTGTGYVVLLPPQHYQDWSNVPRDHVNWGKAINQVSTMVYIRIFVLSHHS